MPVAELLDLQRLCRVARHLAGVAARHCDRGGAPGDHRSGPRHPGRNRAAAVQALEQVASWGGGIDIVDAQDLEAAVCRSARRRLRCGASWVAELGRRRFSIIDEFCNDPPECATTCRQLPPPRSGRAWRVRRSCKAGLVSGQRAHGLLQNLQVRKSASGKFEVVARSRRYAALKLLAKKKALAKDVPVPCHVIAADDASEISLAENEMRQAMHPADQFEAFKALIDAGQGIEDVAAKFGVTATVVRQRLKLASVSPKLMAIYRTGEMTLDLLMAFTDSDDHAAQEAVWSDAPEWQRTAHGIRHALTAEHVRGDNWRARFVTVESYAAAGGGVVTDLFRNEDEGYLTDPALLDRLVKEKLEAEAETVRQEGWQWVETSAGVWRKRPSQPRDCRAFLS
jgi:ParB-like chromosome segregation protein Spo0J